MLINNCSHVAKSANETKLRKAIAERGILQECPECKVEEKTEEPAEGEESELVYEYNETLWMW